MTKVLLVFGIIVVLSFSLISSFFPSVLLSSSAVSTNYVPVWAFNGAYANYTLTETNANQTSDSGWEMFTIGQVNVTSGNFKVTTRFFDELQASLGIQTQNATHNFNQSPVGFPSLNSTQLAMLNQGNVSILGSNISVTTGITASVKAGTFEADKLTLGNGPSYILIDSYSGVFLKLSLSITPSSSLETELASTNIPMISSLPFRMAWIVVSVLAAVFLVIGVLIAIIRRGRVPRSSEMLIERANKETKL